MSERPAVFLDRDGVINKMIRDTEDAAGPPRTRQDLEILPGVVEACGILRRLGYALVLVTNQPDVARGRLDRSEVEELDREIAGLLHLEAVYECFHDDLDACACRKPLPGLLTDAARACGLDLSASLMVGDRWRDIEAGRSAGCRTVWVDSGLNETLRSEPDHRAGSLLAAALWIESVTAREKGDVQIPDLDSLRVQIFADGASEATIAALAQNPIIRGFTTNPTLMRREGVSDYRAFAQRVLSLVGERPISFEVFADDFDEMGSQAREIASWGTNVFVKIPITDTNGKPSDDLIRQLSTAGVQVNVTAVLTVEQVRAAAEALVSSRRGYISMFAGRIADTGRDPVPMVATAVRLLETYPNVQLIWASPRELLNLFHADAVGCHVITVTQDVLAKLNLVGKDLQEYSLDTVRMFQRDAAEAGYRLDVGPYAGGTAAGSRPAAR
jgi:transaldolase